MPSFINELSLRDVKGMVDGASSLILLDPSRLNSADSLKLRKNLHGIGAKLKMAKVNLIRRAVPEGAAKLLDGKTAVGLIATKDMVGAAKIVSDLAKEEKVSVKGGLMDGQVLDPASIGKLANLPGKDQLRGMLVNVLAAPLVGLARVIAEIEKKQKGAA